MPAGKCAVSSFQNPGPGSLSQMRKLIEFSFANSSVHQDFRRLCQQQSSTAGLPRRHVLRPHRYPEPGSPGVIGSGQATIRKTGINHIAIVGGIPDRCCHRPCIARPNVRPSRLPITEKGRRSRAGENVTCRRNDHPRSTLVINRAAQIKPRPSWEIISQRRVRDPSI